MRITRWSQNIWRKLKKTRFQRDLMVIKYREAKITLWHADLLNITLFPCQPLAHYYRTGLNWCLDCHIFICFKFYSCVGSWHIRSTSCTLIWTGSCSVHITYSVYPRLYIGLQKRIKRVIFPPLFSSPHYQCSITGISQIL